MGLVSQPLDRFPRFFKTAAPEGRPREYFVIDFETTGLNPERDSIIEVSCLRMYNRHATEVYTSLVAANGPLSHGIINLTGITDKMLMEAKQLETVAEELGRFFGGRNRPLFAHNAVFEAKFMFCKGIADLLPPQCQICDSMVLAKRAFPGKASYSLDNLAKDLQLRRFRAHSAEGDVLCTALLIETCYDVLCGVQDYAQEELPLGLKEHTCPRCGSPLVCKDGFTQAKTQLYRCKSCGKKFTEGRKVNSKSRSPYAPEKGSQKPAPPLQGRSCRHCGSSNLRVKEHRGESHRYYCKDCRRTTTFRG